MANPFLAAEEIKRIVLKFNELYLDLVNSGEDFDENPKEYEDAVASLAAESIHDFFSLNNTERVNRIRDLLEHDLCDGGWYTGNLPHPLTIRAALRRSGNLSKV